MILVAGSANLDFVVQVAHIPRPGETVLGKNLEFFPGGKGANQAIACARAGDAATEMLLALGDDEFARPIAASLSAAGVNMHVVQIPDQRTGTAFINLSDDAENAITVVPGANASLRADDLPALHAFRYLLLQLETPIPIVISYASAAKAQGLTVILNAAPAQALPRELLSLVDILIVNEDELIAVAGLQGSIAKCLEHIDVPCVVVTLGSRGCCAFTDNQFITQPGFPVTAFDTTAAGDTFCGALAAALSRGVSLAEGLREANAAGALACTKLGAQTSIPNFSDVQKLLQDSTQPVETDHEILQQYCGIG